MSLTPTSDRQIERISRLAFHWNADRMDAPLSSPQDVDDLTLPITGQTYQYSRAVAGGTATGADGETIAAPPRDVPVWAMPELDGERTRPALRLTSGDTFDVDIGFELEACGIYLECVAGSDALAFSVGNQTAPHLTLDSPSAGHYRVTHNNGTDAAVSVTTAVAATAGDRVQLWGELHTDGSVTLWRRYASGDWTEVDTSTAPAAGITATPGAAVASLSTDGTDDVFAAKVDIGPTYDQATIEGVY